MGRNRLNKHEGANQNTTDKGHHFEKLALEYLCNQGLRLICHNFRCRSGEIDLIMRDGQAVVFIEVRFRKNDLYGGGAASVTRTKQARIIRAARFFLATRVSEPRCRFDVVDISRRPDSDGSLCDGYNCYFFNWIQNAFQSDGN